MVDKLKRLTVLTSPWDHGVTMTYSAFMFSELFKKKKLKAYIYLN